MVSLEAGTWHESHVVWHFPPSACVHVTYGTWKMESKCEESERKFPLVGSNKKKKNNSVEERKGKEKKGKKKRKEKKKGNEKNKGKEKKKQRNEERKEMRGKKKREKICVEEKGETKEKGFDSPCSDSQKSLVQELKLVYLTRATSGCHKQKR